MAASRRDAPDQLERDAAIAERARNVVIDAGAGTGKTTIIVDRLVRMVAPPDGSGEPPIPMSRIAAVTFTRRAAGELRLRIRERLLGELAAPVTGGTRRDRLRDALAGLDTAHVGTIHGFADRLLGLRPVEAKLSPSYEIAEDNGKLVRETFEILLHAGQAGTLVHELVRTGAPADSDLAARAAEAERTIVDALQCELRRDSKELEFYTRFGLDALVEAFIEHRDVVPDIPEIVPFDRDAFNRGVEDFLALVAPVAGDSSGARWLRSTAAMLRGLRRESDPALLLRSMRWGMRKPEDPNKGTGFDNDKVAWRAWKLFDEGRLGKDTRAQPLRDDLLGPLVGWLAPRLVRLFPVVIALYERVKERHRAVDQIDLLLELRKLLRDDKRSREHYQSLFDHLFVDEFQDTDPLQAEIVLFLCEDGARAEGWQDVRLASGKLTIVGDPKQSIYRFRRADVGMYDEVRRLITSQEHLAASLSANFRSLEPLIDFFNLRFERLLGSPPDASSPFDPKTGAVYHRPLLPGRETRAKEPCVDVLPLDFPSGVRANTDGYRDLEGEVLALYLRHLVERSGREVQDVVTGESRRIRYGDVAVLTLSTFTLPRLFRSLDRTAVPYSARGGRLFLEDDLHRRFVLGLRAIAEPRDGVARAALLRPPFFAVDPLDLAHQRAQRRAGASDPSAADARARRADEAEAIIRDLRFKRFDRPPGTTARALLDRSALARTVALEPNGAQRLRHLREICLVLETIAAEEGLDFDVATARLRTWIDAPAQLDPPHPVGADAVQVLTVHQAKGLEFPVVVLWDSCALLRAPNDPVPWRAATDGRAWAIALEGLAWESPPGAGLKDAEKRYRDAERKRLVYVAATRARDLLVLPRAAMVKAQHVASVLAEAPPPELALELAPYVQGSGASWSSGIGPPPAPSLNDVTELDRQVAERWREAAAAALRPRFQPVGVTEVAADGGAMLAGSLWGGEQGAAGADDWLAHPRKRREGRFGALFGETVHLAIARAVREAGRAIDEIVREVATTTGLVEHLDDAAADVARAVAALRAEALLGGGFTWRFEYPVAAAREGRLLLGYVDFVSIGETELSVIDFKTSARPSDLREVPREYAAQVRAYGEMLREGGLAAGRSVRTGLLFTAGESILWLDG